VLAPAIVETMLDLESLDEVFAHQLRWARTYRVCRPGSYFALVLTHTTLWATLFLLATGFSTAGWQIFATAVGIRTAAGALIASRVFGVRGIARRLWLIPFKDLFNSAIWALAFLGNTVTWGGTRFAVQPDGRMRALPEPDASAPEPAHASKAA
jgi:ceramide glucosyltransferase